jgi:hypothetical protein
MYQYWRATLHNKRLEQDFFTALELAGTVWFRAGLAGQRELETDDIAEFLQDLNIRTTRAMGVWCSAFNNQLVGVAEGGQGGGAAV